MFLGSWSSAFGHVGDGGGEGNDGSGSEDRHNDVERNGKGNCEMTGESSFDMLGLCKTKPITCASLVALQDWYNELVPKWFSMLIFHFPQYQMFVGKESWWWSSLVFFVVTLLKDLHMYKKILDVFPYRYLQMPQYANANAGLASKQ